MGGLGRARKNGPRLRGWRRLATVGAAFLVVACATQDSEAPVGRDLSGAARLFTVGYRDISDIYIRDTSPLDLAVAGLEGLTSIDPQVEVTHDNTRIQMLLGGEPIASLAEPARGDADGWGQLMATALNVGRSRSSDLRTTQPERLYEVVFDGMLSHLDKFSRYSGRVEALENRASREGFGGIGVRIRLTDDGVHILSVMEHSPAERAGLHDNDDVVEIDGESTVGLSQRDVVRRLRGPLRSEVELTVRRQHEDKPLQLRVVRGHIVPETVRYSRLGRVAHIRVTGFNQSTTRTLREKVKYAAKDIGPSLAGYILDLRGNPGGLLDQSVAVSDMFVTSGRIVSTHGRHPDSHQYFDAEPDDAAHNLPVVVLVNGNSASASEIVAAALQDSGRAAVVGTGSFGKGTVQTVLRLPNDGELTLTWARFHAPSGYALQDRGVMPDVCTAPSLTEGAVGTEQVLNRLRDGLFPPAKSTLRLEVADGDTGKLEAFRATCPPGQSESEVDVEVARRLIEDPTLFARAIGNYHPATDQASVGPIHASLQQ